MSPKVRAVMDALAIQLGRFAVIVAGLAVAEPLGIHGFRVGLFVNVLCVGYAVAVVTWLRLWGEVGLLVRWRSWPALLWLLPFLVEAMSWLWPDGPHDQAPGVGWWTLTLLLVGVNEELTGRGAVLLRLLRDLGPVAAVVWCGVLFGAQHLSALVTSNASLLDVLTNVGLTTAYGLALAAYQARFRWLWPLILVHAGSDLAGELTPGSPGDAVVLPAAALMLATAVALLVGRRSSVSRTGPGVTPPPQARPSASAV
ncbi:CPBP family intramembrane glutamic endopeptidase [Micromonospora sp. WMMD754]|uniref:CPBP family intramembrane glutamic endopeptidase n=1 Tax=Micromonospora sp. WMMD754 TaxID=3404114 RepID=UPI003BF4EE34